MGAITVPFSEVVGSPVETMTVDGVSAEATYECAWGFRATLAQQLLADGGQPYYRMVGGAVARASSVKVQPATQRQVEIVDGVASYASYETARLVVSYTTDGPEVVDDKLVDERFEKTVEFMTLDPTGFRWGATGDALTEEEAPGKQLWGYTYSLTYYNIDPFPGDVFDLGGMVNDDVVTPFRIPRDFAAGTMLLEAPTISRAVTTDEEEAWTMDVVARIRNAGWNKYWRPGTQSWESIYVHNPTTDTWEEYLNYPEGDFTPIFG